MIVVDFALGPIGFAVPPQFVTPEGLQANVPAGSRVSAFGSRIGLYVNTHAALVPPSPAEEVTLKLYAGSKPPIIRLIDSAGSLLDVFPTASQPDHVVTFVSPRIGNIAVIEIDFQSGEGGLLMFGACGDETSNLRAEAFSEVEILAVDQSVCQAIVYAETGTIETNQDGLAGLAEARQFIAAVAYNRSGSGVASPKYPSPDELKQPFIKRAWDRCGTAAKDALHQEVGNCNHFVVWYSDDQGATPSRNPSSIPDDWPYTQSDKITKHWGPYKVNELNGSNIYVIKYCGVP